MCRTEALLRADDRDPMTNAEPDALRHLPRLHYGLAVLVAAATIAVAFPVAAGWHALSSPELHADALTGDRLPPPSSGGWIFLVGGLLVISYGVALAVALALSGRAIARRRRHGFCLVTSFLATFFFPFGTLLGFHTLHALCEPTAREAFGLAPGGAPPGAAR
jgi:hypothetical protein